MDLGKIEKKIEGLIARALGERVFSGASVGLASPHINPIILSFGRTDFYEHKHKITRSTFFDLASLTKPLVTTLSLAVLIEQGKLSLDTKLCELLEKFTITTKKNINIGHLLSHSSGLPAHRHYFTRMLEVAKDKREQDLISWISTEGLLSQPGEQTVYSDLGFILLGKIVEGVANQKLAEFWQKNINLPLFLEKELLFGEGIKRGLDNCAATGCDPCTDKILCGMVHDDNCRLMGGLAGHAGLFGTAAGVLQLCTHLVDIWHNRSTHLPISGEVFRLLCHKRAGSTWAHGFDTPSQLLSSSGKYFQQPSIGHLGFTGTSFWIDLKREIVLVFLTNRVLSEQSNEKIKLLRPMLHNAILEEFAP